MRKKWSELEGGTKLYIVLMMPISFVWSVPTRILIMELAIPVIILYHLQDWVRERLLGPCSWLEFIETPWDWLMSDKNGR